MEYQKGDIVLLPFPFTDLSSAKTRPTVVLSMAPYQLAMGALVVAMITSNPHATPYDYAIQDWQAANLLTPSWVRLKIATIDAKLVRYRPGHLAKQDWLEVERLTKNTLGG
jgi:mRNA interferase MazF